LNTTCADKAKKLLYKVESRPKYNKHVHGFEFFTQTKNKCIGDDTKAAAHQSLNCIKNKNNNMAKNDFQYAGWNSYTLQCGMWLWNSDSEFTKWQHPECDTWLWDDMPLNSPKRPPYWNSTSGFQFHTSPQSTCHYVPVCEILSKSDHPRQKK